MDFGTPKVIPEFTSLQVNTAVQALPVPMIYGSPRCSLNIIYYNGFNVVQQQVGGGKGVLTGGKGGTQTEYFATLIMALGEGPITDVLVIYQNSATYTPADFPTNGAYFFQGTDTQTPWSYITSNWPNDARGYKDTSYYGFSNAQLDSSATVPQIGIVPKGLLYGTSPLNNSSITITSGQYDQAGNPTSFVGTIQLGTCDADPGQVLLDLLSNSRYGANFPLSYIDTASLLSGSLAFDPNYGDQAISTFCQAAGIAWSIVFNNPESTNSVISRLCENMNVAPVWDGALLRFIPYWDQYVGTNPGWYSGNGIGMKYFNPCVVPITQITLDDVLQLENQDDDPIKFSRKDPQLVYNTVKMEFKDRSNFFNANVVEAKDEAHIELYGPLVDNIGSAEEFTLSQYANVAAQMRLRRNISIMRNFTLKLNPLWGWIAPMQIFQIPDPANLSNFIDVRVISVEDQEDESVVVEFEEFPQGAQSPSFIPTSQTTPPNQGQTNIPSAPVFPPVIFEPTSSLLSAQGYTTNQVILGVSGGYNGVVDSYYGGCVVWISTDGVNFEQEGKIKGPSAVGVLAQALPGYASANPDNINLLVVNLSQCGLTLPSTSAAAAAAGRSICVVKDASGFELLSYTNSVLTSPDVYTATQLYRGLYGTTSRLFGAGSQFLYFPSGLDNFLETSLSSSYIGLTLYVKFQSFNTYNNYTQDLASCQVYEYTVQGSTPSSIIPPMNKARNAKNVANKVTARRRGFVI